MAIATPPTSPQTLAPSPPIGQAPPPNQPLRKRSWWQRRGRFQKLLIVVAAAILAIIVVMILSNKSAQSPAATSPTTSQQATTPATAKASVAATAKATATVAPQPVAFAGQGDSVVRVPLDLQSKPQLVTAANSGGANFAVESLGSDNSTQELLVNTIGAYSGTTALNFLGQSTTFLKVTSTGSWTLKLSDITSGRAFSTSISGHGDDVLIYKGGSAIGTIDNSGGENFAVTEYPQGSPNLLVNTIGKYHGQQPLSKGPSALVIVSTGSWSISAQ